MARYAVKICGVCRPQDARLASEAGADFVGFLVDVPHTPRSLLLEQARAVADASSVRRVLLLWEPTAERAAELAVELQVHAIQLVGDESPELLRQIKSASGVAVWKAIHLPARGRAPAKAEELPPPIRRYEEAGADLIVLDAKAIIGGVERRGGTGQVSDWNVASEIIRRTRTPVLLAGGINPDNVVEAIRATHPFGVDLSSGAESEPCRKDPWKVRTIVQRVRAAEQQ